MPYYKSYVFYSCIGLSVAYNRKLSSLKLSHMCFIIVSFHMTDFSTYTTEESCPYNYDASDVQFLRAGCLHQHSEDADLC